MSQPYSVKVTITSAGGATVYALQVAQGDDTDGNVAAAYGLADPLVITQRLQQNPRLPLSHPEPDEATVSIIAPDSSTYVDMAKGDPVGIQVYPAASFAGTPVEFYGRINGLTASPHDLGTMLTVSCIDYTADLAQLPIGAAAYPIESADLRINRMCDEVGLPRFGTLPVGWVYPTATLVSARSAGVGDLLSETLNCLDAWTQNYFRDENGANLAGSPIHTVGFRPCLVQNITGGLLDPTTPFSWRFGKPWTRRVQYAPPGRIANVGGLQTITMAAANSSPTTGAPIVDAGKVLFATTFTQDIAGGLPAATTGSDSAGNAYTWDWRAETTWGVGGGLLVGGRLFRYGPAIAVSGPVLTQVIDSTIDPTDNAPNPPWGLVAVYRVPFRPDTKASWNLPSLDWQLWAESGPWRRPDLTELFTVARVQTAKVPNRREWVSGLVSATTLTIAGGRPVLSVDLLPPSYDFELQRWATTASLGVASMDSPILAGVTLAGLSTRDTFTDYQLARGS
jgi:hypothetical protein